MYSSFLSIKLSSKKFIILLTGGIVIIILSIFSAYDYPPPRADSVYYVVPAFNYAIKGELSNPIIHDEFINFVDPSGERKFIYQPPLYPLLIGILLKIQKNPTPTTFFIIITIINGIIILSTTFILYRIARQGRIDFLTILGIGLAVIIMASANHTGMWRMEILSELFVALVLLFGTMYSWMSIPSSILGILLGLTITIHPSHGILSFIIIHIYLSISHRSRRLLLSLMKLYGVGLGVASLIIALSPFTAQEIIRGTVRHFLNVGGFPLFSLFTDVNIYKNFIFQLPAPPFLIILILICFQISFSNYKNTSSLIYKPLLILLLLLIIYWRRLDYFVIFLPLILIIIIYGLSIIKNQPIRYCIIFSLFLSSLFFFRLVLLFPYYLRNGISLKEIRSDQEIKKFLFKNNDKLIGISEIFWTISENYKNIRFIPIDRPDIKTDIMIDSLKKKKITIFILQQIYFPRYFPPHLDRCTILKNTFIPKIPYLLFIPLAKTIPSYAYVIYDCSSI